MKNEDVKKGKRKIMRIWSKGIKGIIDWEKVKTKNMKNGISKNKSPKKKERKTGDVV